MSLADAVLRTIRRYQLLPKGGRVLCALSGGADSVALLHILLELQARGELVVAGVAHFNHGLRGAQADADEQFCRSLADSLGLPFEAGRGSVAERARAEKRSIEDTARAARYEFLAEAADRLAADAVAVGHTREDQAETFLLRLIRGAGTRGLGGIRPRAGNVIRPLIEISRDGLRAYAAGKQLAHREDATNTDVAIPRNRVRHELIPYLQRDFSPGIVEVLAREAAIAQQDEDKLHAEAIDLTASIVLTDNHGAVTVDADALNRLHPAIASRVAREALRRLGGDRFIGFDHVQRFLELAATGTPGAAMSLPGQQARLCVGPPRIGETGSRVAPPRFGEAGPRIIQLGLEPPRGERALVSPKPRSGEGGNSFRIPLSIPGEVVLAPQGLAVSADWGQTAGVSAGCLIGGVKLPLAVRSREAGDRFTPPGLGGRSKKLQDYLVDRKVPHAERDLLPLVVDDDNRIVWVVGHGVAEDFRVLGPERGVISLKARRLGGEG
jgi:tRNA(Ile)-lysidine synthase